MDRAIVFQKTAKGQEEIASRAHKLSLRLRPLLIMVDGKTSAADLMAKAGQFGDVEDSLRQLVEGGFVEAAKSAAPAAVAGPVPPVELVRLINRALYEAIGPHADHFGVRIESCKTYAELEAVLAKCNEAVHNIGGRRKLEQFRATLAGSLPQAA